MSIRLNVIDREGKKTALDLEEGTTIRDAIEEKLSPDYFGICGGNCACGTCHVVVAPSDFEKLKAAEESSSASLACALAEYPVKFLTTSSSFTSTSMLKSEPWSTSIL